MYGAIGFMSVIERNLIFRRCSYTAALPAAPFLSFLSFSEVISFIFLGMRGLWFCEAVMFAMILFDPRSNAWLRPSRWLRSILF